MSLLEWIVVILLVGWLFGGFYLPASGFWNIILAVIVLAIVFGNRKTV